jgi:Tol biopolymer transport system component
MKLSNLVLTATLIFCLTLVVATQLRAQGPPLPTQPAISMDFAQYCIGNSWQFRLRNGVPSAPLRLLGNSNGQSWEITNWGTTDAAGNFTAQGTFAEGTAGTHSLQLDFAGTLSNTVYFVVSQCSVQSPRIAFASTRDGGGPPAGWLSVPYIYVANADGSGVTRLTQGEMPAWSADGQRIAFQTRTGPEIRVINADGSNERVLARGLWPSWSQDGTKIVFFSATGGAGGGIFMMNADGSGITQLISNEFANSGGGDYAVELPTWSPDGRSIAFVRTNYDDPWTVHILDLATSQISLVGTPMSVGDSRPVWSPDGTRLLLQLPFWEIASVNRDGSGLQKYVEAPYVGNPDWSPDAKSIVFEKFTGPGNQTSPIGSRMRIFVTNPDDGSVRQLIPEAATPALPDYWDSEPAWSRVRQ